MKNVEKVFHIFSISILVIFILLFASRAIYYKNNMDKKKNYSDILYERIMEHENNYELISELTKIDGKYYYTKKAKSNYVNYKGLLWRIIKIDKDKSITMILDNSITNLSYEYIYNWLNISDEENSGTFYKLINNDYSENKKKNVDNFMHKKENSCEPISDNRIYLLTEEDYNNAGGKDSFINNHTDFWISNNKKQYIDITGNIEIDDTKSTHDIRPVIILNGNISAESGNGTSDDPYYIQRKEVEKLYDVENNSYIIFNDTLWRVQSNNKDSIKLVSEECVKDKEDKCININFSNDNNSINKYNKNSVIYYLNNDYYNKIKNKEFIKKGTFYIGKVDKNNYLNIYTEKINLKVGMLTILDPYAFDINNTFLITGNTDSNLSIYTSQDNHSFETIVTEKAYIRPVIYLDNNINVIKGNGTYKSPYRLEGDYEEE